MKVLFTRAVLIILFLQGTIIYAQKYEILTDVIPLAGGYDTSATGLLVSWTLGEPFVKYKQGDSFTLSEGFQQVYSNLPVSSDEVNISDYGILLFPNPSRDFLFIRQKKIVHDLSIQILQINGILVSSYRIYSNHEQLDLSRLPVGQYLVHLVLDNKSFTYKMIKH